MEQEPNAGNGLPFRLEMENLLLEKERLNIEKIKKDMTKEDYHYRSYLAPFRTSKVNLLNQNLAVNVIEGTTNLNEYKETLMNKATPLDIGKISPMSSANKKVPMYMLAEGETVTDNAGLQTMKVGLFLALTEGCNENFDTYTQNLAFFAMSCQFISLSNKNVVAEFQKRGFEVTPAPFDELFQELVVQHKDLMLGGDKFLEKIEPKFRDDVSEICFALFIMALTENITELNAATWLERRVKTLCSVLGIKPFDDLLSLQLSPTNQNALQAMVNRYFPLTKVLVFSLKASLNNVSTAGVLSTIVIKHMEYAMMTNFMLAIKNIINTNAILVLDPLIYTHLPDLRIAIQKCEAMGPDHKFAKLLYNQDDTKWLGTQSMRALGTIGRIIGVYSGDRKLQNFKGSSEDRHLAQRIFNTLDNARKVMYKGAEYAALTMIHGQNPGLTDMSESFRKTIANNDDLAEFSELTNADV